MSFKDLSLDRSKIDIELKSLPDLYIEGPTNVQPNVIQYLINKIEEPKNKGILNVYSKDGLTTLSVQGKNKDLATNAAKHIVATCSKGCTKHVNLTFPNVDKMKFDLVYDYLVDERNAKVLEDNIKNGIKYTFIGENEDSITLNYYTNSTLLFQGKQQFLYSDFIEIASNVLDYKEVIKEQLKVIEVNNSAEETIDIFKISFPASHKYLGNTLTAIISPSLVLRKLNIELTDYSSFAFPILKGLEGFLKKIFKEYNFVVTKDGFGEWFNFDNSTKKWKLHKKYRDDIKNGKIISVIEDIYLYFKIHRNGLFHVDSDIESSKVINNKSDADSVINTVIKIIEESYTTLQKENSNIGKSI